MTASPVPEANEAALAELLGEHRLLIAPSPESNDIGMFVKVTCTCDDEWDASMPPEDWFNAHLASVLLAAGWLPPETVTERGDALRAEGLRVAALLLRRVAEYWDGRPLTHHGDHIHADFMDVLRAVEADADSLAPEAPTDPTCVCGTEESRHPSDHGFVDAAHYYDLAPEAPSEAGR